MSQRRPSPQKSSWELGLGTAGLQEGDGELEAAWKALKESWVTSPQPYYLKKRWMERACRRCRILPVTRKSLLEGTALNAEPNCSSSRLELTTRHFRESKMAAAGKSDQFCATLAAAAGGPILELNLFNICLFTERQDL